MSDAMVTARMTASKKTAGTRVLEDLGYNASQVINELFDRLIESGTLPWGTEERTTGNVSPERLQAALAWVDELASDIDERFSTMSDDQIRVERLRSRGLMGD